MCRPSSTTMCRFALTGLQRLYDFNGIRVLRSYDTLCTSESVTYFGASPVYYRPKHCVGAFIIRKELGLLCSTVVTRSFGESYWYE